MTGHRPRHGFTLIELLVVTGLLSMFFALIVKGMRPSQDAQVKQCADFLVSAVMSAQTEALKANRGEMLTFAADASGAMSTAVSFATPRDSLRATVGSLVRLGPRFDKASLTLGVLLNGDSTDVRDGFLVAFRRANSDSEPYGAWFAFEANPNDPPPHGFVRLRTDVGQSMANTTWPPSLADGPLECMITLAPNESSPAFTTPKAAAIDMRYSGIGDEHFGSFSNILGSGSSTIVLDIHRAGGIKNVIAWSPSAKDVKATAIVPFAPIYLLVCSREALTNDIAGNTSRTLASQAATWLQIDPATGAVSTSRNRPQVQQIPKRSDFKDENEFRLAYVSYMQGLRGGLRSSPAATAK